MHETAMEQSGDGLVRVPAEVVNDWLHYSLVSSDEDLYELVKHGRSEDGSFEADPGTIARIVELTDVGVRVPTWDARYAWSAKLLELMAEQRQRQAPAVLDRVQAALKEADAAMAKLQKIVHSHYEEWGEPAMAAGGSTDSLANMRAQAEQQSWLLLRSDIAALEAVTGITAEYQEESK